MGNGSFERSEFQIRSRIFSVLRNSISFDVIGSTLCSPVLRFFLVCSPNKCCIIMDLFSTLSVTNNVVCVCACCLNECVRIFNSFWYFSFRSLAISPPGIRQCSFKTFANNMNCCVFERSEMLVNYMASSCLRVSILLPLIALTRKRFGNYLYHIK